MDWTAYKSVVWETRWGRVGAEVDDGGWEGLLRMEVLVLVFEGVMLRQGWRWVVWRGEGGTCRVKL